MAQILGSITWNNSFNKMLNYLRSAIVFLFIFLASCGTKDDGAALRLNKARELFSNKNYSQAKLEIDSLHILYPKAFDERKAGLALLDTIRKEENIQIINECDSLIKRYTPELEKIKSLFSFQRNKEYQETGTYIPRESVANTITGTTFRSGVTEEGKLYLESVFMGQQKHDRIKIAARDGSFAESLPVKDDGLNYRFSNMGNNYEIIRFAGETENGIAKFIYSNQDKPLTLTLLGTRTYSYTLSQTIKSAVSKSFQLSTMMLQLDSLNKAKEEAEFRNYYLDNKKGKKAKETGEM